MNFGTKKLAVRCRTMSITRVAKFCVRLPALDVQQGLGTESTWDKSLGMDAIMEIIYDPAADLEFLADRIPGMAKRLVQALPRVEIT